MQLTKNKAALCVAIATVVLVAYQYSFPTKQYFECKVGEIGSEWEESEEGKKEVKRFFLTSEYMTVKKYIFGMFYTINNYEKSDCERYEDTLLCGKNDDIIHLDMVNGQMSETKKIDGKTNRKSVWKCERTERLVK